jgi:2-(1,2-epoxy-1,2-dihydrophenyl)acetyl-CoA isomerase
MSRPSVTLTREDALAIVTLSQPGRGNPVDARLAADLQEVTLELRQDRSVGVVLLRAEGTHFSRGREAIQADATGHLRTYETALTRLWQLPVPVMVTVQGHAHGAGCGLPVACDLVLAGESARFAAPTPGLELLSDSGTLLRLAQRMGVARARRFCLFREALSAREALAAGLVDRILPDEDLTRTAFDQAHKLAAGAIRDYASVKARFARLLPIDVEAAADEARADADAIPAIRDDTGDAIAINERHESRHAGE